jgi:hypothetical protein
VNTVEQRTRITAAELAREWGISINKVRHWIATQQLRAQNLAKDPGGRPRYSISRAAIEEFERNRETTPIQKPMRSTPRRQRTMRIESFI